MNSKKCNDLIGGKVRMYITNEGLTLVTSIEKNPKLNRVLNEVI